MRVMKCHMCMRSGVSSDNNKLYVCPDCAPPNTIAINMIKERTENHVEETNKKNDT